MANVMCYNLIVQGNRLTDAAIVRFEDFFQLRSNEFASSWRSPVTNLAIGFPEQKLAKGVAGLSYARKNEMNAQLQMLRSEVGYVDFAVVFEDGKKVFLLPYTLRNGPTTEVYGVNISYHIFSCSDQERAEVERVYRASQNAITVFFELCLYDSPSYPYRREQLEEVLTFPLSKSERLLIEAQIQQLTCIYLIRDARTGLTKIGRSNQPESRLKQLIKQDTLLPQANDFSLILCWEDYGSKENVLHGEFAHLRVRGEWFNLSDDDVERIRTIFQH